VLSVDGLGKSVTAFPNPARTTTKVVIDAPEAGRGAIIMFDALGRQVQNLSAQLNKGINQFDMNVSNLASGEYKIQVRGAGLNETIKLQKIQ
ncbi:MAG TPA: T9SS type A sorting domain-containing protein, partial [Phnomibacter sp.]|nr:T9SS type A sorting domain-containing protein [Phnomibacter sp.]